MRWPGAVVALGMFGSVALAGDGDAARREEIVKSMVTAMNDLTKVLSKIRDEESARLHKDDLKKAAEQWQALRKRAEKVPPPTQAESEVLAKRYKTRLEEAQQFLFREIARIQREVPGGKEALKDILKAFDKKADPPSEKKASPPSQ